MPAFLGKGRTIVGEPAKSNPAIAFRSRGVAGWCEAGLNVCVFALPPVLALAPHGAATLAGAAGLCAAGMVFAGQPSRLSELRVPAVLLAALLLWGALSALWSITPARSLVLQSRLAGLFAAALALLAAADRVAAPQRFAASLLAGTGLGVAIALVDLISGGGFTRLVSVRTFGAPRLNDIAAWLAIVWLPAAALLVCRGWAIWALPTAAVMAGTVFALQGAAAQIALAMSLPVAALCYFRRRAVARVLACLSVLAILTMPLTLPRLAAIPGLVARVDTFKNSAGHRLLIWSFTGARISEHPFIGWGLDTARAIPGGKDEIRPGQSALPLHPHNAALQVWLELGAPGAALLALIVGILWWRLGEVRWPPLYAAAAAGSLAAALTVAEASWGIWQEWWLGTLAMALFAILVLARAADDPR